MVRMGTSGSFVAANPFRIQAGAAHQTNDTLMATTPTTLTQNPMDLGAAIDLTTCLANGADLIQQSNILLAATTWRSVTPGLVTAAGDAERLTQ